MNKNIEEIRGTFEQFLMEKHCVENPQLLDDMLCDDFFDWLGGLDPDTLIKYGNEFEQSIRKEERERVMLEIDAMNGVDFAIKNYKEVFDKLKNY